MRISQKYEFVGRLLEVHTLFAIDKMNLFLVCALSSFNKPYIQFQMVYIVQIDKHSKTSSFHSI